MKTWVMTYIDCVATTGPDAYITKGKWYEVLDPEFSGFYFVDECGERLYSFFDGTCHLDFSGWQIHKGETPPMTIDLTKITTPLGLLDDETRQALIDHGGPYEWFTGDVWFGTVSPAANGLVYRVKSETPDEIDWSHVSDDYNWMARDEDGVAYLYSDKPKAKGNNWWGNEALTECEAFKSYKSGTVSWENSLVERPKQKG